MESTVQLKIQVTVEPGTEVYRYNERFAIVEPMTVLETHIVKSPYSDEYGNQNFRSCLEPGCTLQPNYSELVIVKSKYSEKSEPELIPIENIWPTPEEAMEAYTKMKLNQYNKLFKK